MATSLRTPLCRASTSAQRFARGPAQLPHPRLQRPQRRTLFTPPALRPRSFKSSAARWIAAGAGVYWYANSDIDLFNREANEHGRTSCIRNTLADIQDVGKANLSHLYSQELELPTLESVAALRRERLATAGVGLAPAPTAIGGAAIDQPSSPAPPSYPPPDSPAAALGSPDELEEEAGAQGAFNEETGEINWECPCLGGMAHGPCGVQFRDAFSCFVYSKEEPKGVECIEKFKVMQDCFRQYPDVYGAELGEDYEEGDAAGGPGLGAEGAEPTGAEPSSRPEAAAAAAAPARTSSESDSESAPRAKPGKKSSSKSGKSKSGKTSKSGKASAALEPPADGPNPQDELVPRDATSGEGDDNRTSVN